MYNIYMPLIFWQLWLETLYDEIVEDDFQSDSGWADDNHKSSEDLQLQFVIFFILLWEREVPLSAIKKNPITIG